jgi:hypothetical protein
MTSRGRTGLFVRILGAAGVLRYRGGLRGDVRRAHGDIDLHLVQRLVVEAEFVVREVVGRAGVVEVDDPLAASRDGEPGRGAAIALLRTGGQVGDLVVDQEPAQLSAAVTPTRAKSSM